MSGDETMLKGALHEVAGTRTPPLALYIDPVSHHFLQNRLFSTDTGPAIGDALNAPYVLLRERLEALGVPVRTADYLPPADGETTNVYVSLGILENYRSLARRPDVVLSAFFALECPIVEPSIYRQLGEAQRYFQHIFSWSDSSSLEPFVGAPFRCELFRWPQSFERVHEDVWGNSRRKFLVMINSNKSPRVYWQELYSERLRAVEFFSRDGSIDLYGPGWDLPPNRVGKSAMPYTLRRIQRSVTGYWQRLRPDPLMVAARRVWRGRASTKAAVLGSYTFALCFENMILRGWITEKIFDCFFAGTVPIYWGAPEIHELIPPECFVDMRDFRDYAELQRFLRAQSPHDVARYRAAAREFLASPGFEPFSKEAFSRRFVDLVKEASSVRAARTVLVREEDRKKGDAPPPRT